LHTHETLTEVAYKEATMATNEITSSRFDPASIPVPPLHGCQIRPDMTFAEAASAFDDWRSCAPDEARYRSHGTLRDCRTKIKALNKFFGSLKLRDIHIGHIREYQKDRFSNGRGVWAHPAGADKINQEMGLQLRIMRLGNAFTGDLEKYYQTLQVDECEIPKGLSQEEQERFLDVAGSNPEWHIVWWYSEVAVTSLFPLTSSGRCVRATSTCNTRSSQ
jgi:hypothetical protein